MASRISARISLQILKKGQRISFSYVRPSLYRLMARWHSIGNIYVILREMPNCALNLPISELFNYFSQVFKECLNQDVTVAFYGPQPFLVAMTPNTVEVCTFPKSKIRDCSIFCVTQLGNANAARSSNLLTLCISIVLVSYTFLYYRSFASMFDSIFRAAQLMFPYSPLSRGFFRTART